MKRWISFSHSEGVVSRQAHCDLPANTFEREQGREGFFGPTTLFYHVHPPTGWQAWDGPLKPHAYDLNRLEQTVDSPWRAVPVFQNQHVQCRWWRLTGKMQQLVRNGDGDELLFIHQGSGDLFCDFGRLSIQEGDYVVIPRGTMWRIESQTPIAALLVEATEDAYMLPEKGLVGNHAIFDPAVLEIPRMDATFKAQQGEFQTQVVIKRRNKLSTVTYPYNPLDAIGWHGDLAVVKLNWRDIRPLMSHRYHLPPSAHTTFLAKRFVVCTFVPRPIESDPGALKVPFYHNNDDYDEIIFYHRGEFFSRDNIKPGMMTFHPCGFTHGPHPKAFAAGKAAAKKETDEVAVMIDTRDPVDFSSAASETEWADYVYSWRTKAD